MISQKTIRVGLVVLAVLLVWAWFARPETLQDKFRKAGIKLTYTAHVRPGIALPKHGRAYDFEIGQGKIIEQILLNSGFKGHALTPGMRSYMYSKDYSWVPVSGQNVWFDWTASPPTVTFDPDL